MWGGPLWGLAWGWGGERPKWGAQLRLATGSASGLRDLYGAFTGPSGWRKVRRMEFRVLGTIEVAGPSPGPSPPGAKERAILARLLLAPGRTVSADALLEAAWEGVPREVAARSLPVRVANLRAFLEPGRDRGAPSSLLVRDGAGYRLEVTPEQVDAQRFERSLRKSAALTPAAALELLDGALALWRGPPFGELADAEFARTEVRRLEDLRSQAEEARARALVELGRPREAIDELRRLAAADPLREELVRTLMLALYAAGRQVDALGAYRDLAARLRELGLAPGAATRELEQRILEHDATLAAPATPLDIAAPAPAPPGREPELARLRAALGRALSGQRAGVLASGEPGAGKSTLVDAFLREAAGGAVAGVGQCLAQRGPGEPYMPVLEALGALARGPAGETVVAALSERAPTWLVELPWLLGEGAAAEAVRRRAQGSTRSRMLREMLEALDAVCASAPVVLVLEDLHWADDSTLDLVAALLRRREPARLLLLGTYRPEGEPPVVELAHDLAVRGLCEELSVGRLAPAAVAAHLEARFPSGPLPEGLAEALARRSGGNPLFMRNLLDHWLADGALTERAGAVELTCPPEALEAGVPPTLRAHIRDQLDRLPAEDAAMLGAASVAGRDFSVDTLAAALEHRPRGGRGAMRRAGAAHAPDRAARGRPPVPARPAPRGALRAAGARRAGATARPRRRPPRRQLRRGGFRQRRRARLPLRRRARSRARRAVPPPGRGAGIRAQRPRRGHPPPARGARRRRRARGRLGAHALGGGAALLARPGAGGDRRLVGGGGRGLAAARPCARRAALRQRAAGLGPARARDALRAAG